MRLTIRHQLLLPLVTLMLGVVALSAWIAWAAAERARAQIEAQLEGVAKTVGTVSIPLNQQTLNSMKGMSGAEFLLCDSRRQPLMTPQGQPLTTLTTLPADLPAATARDRLHLAPRVAIAGQEYFCQGVALQSDVGANRVLYFFYPESLLREAVMQAIQPALIIGAIGGTIALALTLLMTQRITRRLRELVRRTRLIADGDFSPMPLGERRDELQELGQAVNEMAGRLAKSEDALRSSERLRLLGQVSGGLAHQLRNGVAGAKLAVQLHARSTPGIEELDVALRQLSLVEIQLKRFLDLGKATQLNCQPCDLGAIVEDSVALLRPSCIHTRIALRWQPPSEPVSLSADAHQLSQVVLNLLTNAIEAAGPGGWIEVRVGLVKKVAFIEVNDSGAGLDPKVVDRLFEPFVTSKPEGVGLGLAVARQIVEAHVGTIVWERRGDSTCFRIELPVAT